MSGALDTLVGIADAATAPEAAPPAVETVPEPSPAPAPETPPAEPAPAPETPQNPEGDGGEAAAETAVPGSTVEAAAEPQAETAAEAAPEVVAEPVAELPTYEAWNLPEGLTMQDEQVGAMNDLFGRHGLTQEAGQELVEFAGGILKARQEQMLQDQQDTFLATRHRWASEAEKRFGNQYATITSDAKRAMEMAVPLKKREAFSQMLRVTGAGDNPDFIEAWGALGKMLREGRAPGPTTPAPPRERREDRRYRPRAPQ